MIDGKVVLVTGATDGLGRGVAEALAQRGAIVLVHGRDRARTAELAGQLHARAYVADLASLEEVRRLADELLAHEPRLDVLVNNAGIGADLPTRERAESRDGTSTRRARQRPIARPMTPPHARGCTRSPSSWLAAHLALQRSPHRPQEKSSTTDRSHRARPSPASQRPRRTMSTHVASRTRRKAGPRTPRSALVGARKPGG